MEAKAVVLYKESLVLLEDDKELIEHLANILIERWVLSKEEIFEEIEYFLKTTEKLTKSHKMPIL
jgi:hypothetical protein